MPPTLIRDVRVFDGISVIHEVGSVLIDGDKIVSVSESAPKDIPDNTEIIDGTGKTLLPGLIDCHVHAGSDPEDLKQPLRFGVTTVLDMHNDPKAVTELTKAAQSSSDKSDFKSACHAATIEGGWPAPIYEMQKRKKNDGHDHSQDSHGHSHDSNAWSHISSEDTVEDFVKKNVADGCSYIKLMQESGANFSAAFPTPTPSLQSAVVRAAHNHNLLAVGHATSAEDALLLLKAGVDGLMHIPHDIPPTQSLIADFISLCKPHPDKRTFVTPTLTAFSSGTGANATTLAFLSDPVVRAKLSAKSAAQLSAVLNFPGYRGTMSNAYAWVRALKAAGGGSDGGTGGTESVDVILGTDASPFVPGVAMGASAIQELEMYVSGCGFSSVEALAAATGLAAACFGLEDRGRVRAGARADLVLCAGDVVVDVKALRDLEGVWKAGVRL